MSKPNSRWEAIKAALVDGPLTTKQIAERTGLHPINVKSGLCRYQVMGLIKHRGYIANGRTGKRGGAHFAALWGLEPCAGE